MGYMGSKGFRLFELYAGTVGKTMRWTGTAACAEMSRSKNPIEEVKWADPTASNGTDESIIVSR